VRNSVKAWPGYSDFFSSTGNQLGWGGGIKTDKRKQSDNNSRFIYKSPWAFPYNE
jgi:hypothetical protein